jgi:hypothetical protein
LKNKINEEKSNKKIRTKIKNQIKLN